MPNQYRQCKYNNSSYFNRCDINICDAKGRSALHQSVIGNNAKIVKLLLTNGADQCIRDNYNKNAEDYAHEKVTIVLYNFHTINYVYFTTEIQCLYQTF